MFLSWLQSLPSEHSSFVALDWMFWPGRKRTHSLDATTGWARTFENTVSAEKKWRYRFVQHVQTRNLICVKLCHCSCWRHFFVSRVHKHLGNEFSMPRFVRVFAARVRARAQSVVVLHSKRKHVRSYSLYSKHLTRSQNLVPARCTNVTHIVIPLSRCKRHCFPKWRCTFVRQEQSSHNAYGILERVIFQAEKGAPVVFHRLQERKGWHLVACRENGLIWTGINCKENSFGY